MSEGKQAQIDSYLPGKSLRALPVRGNWVRNLLLGLLLIVLIGVAGLAGIGGTWLIDAVNPTPTVDPISATGTAEALAAAIVDTAVAALTTPSLPAPEQTAIAEQANATVVAQVLGALEGSATEEASAEGEEAAATDDPTAPIATNTPGNVAGATEEVTEESTEEPTETLTVIFTQVNSDEQVCPPETLNQPSDNGDPAPDLYIPFTLTLDSSLGTESDFSVDPARLTWDNPGQWGIRLARVNDGCATWYPMAPGGPFPLAANETLAGQLFPAADPPAEALPSEIVVSARDEGTDDNTEFFRGAFVPAPVVVFNGNVRRLFTEPDENSTSVVISGNTIYRLTGRLMDTRPNGDGTTSEYIDWLLTSAGWYWYENDNYITSSNSILGNDNLISLLPVVEPEAIELPEGPNESEAAPAPATVIETQEVTAPESTGGDTGGDGAVNNTVTDEPSQ